MAEHVLVLGGGMQLPELLRTLGSEVRTTVMCQLPVVRKLRDQTGHQAIVGLPADAPMSTWLHMASSLHELDPFTRIASFAERDQDRAAAIGESLGLAMHSRQTIDRVHDKAAMRARLAELGVDDTPFAIVDDVSQLQDFVGRHGYPCIVKPVIGAGSIGITRVTGEDALSVAVERAAKLGEWTRGGALVERLHDGPQYSVEAFSADGEHEIICCTRKYSDVERFVEVGHVLPAPLSDVEFGQVSDYVRRVLDALEIRFGPTHTEIVLTVDGPRIIETHTRLGGDRLPDLVHDALGVDLVGLTVRQVLGNTGLLGEVRAALGKARAAAPRHCAIWYSATNATGTLVSVDGADEVAARLGVDEVVIECEPGQRVHALSESESRLANVRAHGASASEAIERARDAATALRFCVVLDLDTTTDADAAQA